jgi:hypothetical protein
VYLFTRLNHGITNKKPSCLVDEMSVHQMAVYELSGESNMCCSIVLVLSLQFVFPVQTLQLIVGKKKIRMAL